MPTESPDPLEPVFTAADLVAYLRAQRRLPEILPPQSVILAFQHEVVDYARRTHRTRTVKLFGGELHLFDETENRIGLIGGFGAGSPATAAVVDQLAAFGVKRFVSVGLAGGLQPKIFAGSLVVATAALRREGTSGHYLPPNPTVDSSIEMVQGISRILTNYNQPHTLGITWTTDAPFREGRLDVLDYQSQGVLAVDMEAAALLSVARANQLDAVAVFSIADQLSDGTWKMTDDLRSALAGLFILFDAAFEHLHVGSR